MSTLVDHPATDARLDELWANLWERADEEFARLGITKEQALTKAKHSIRHAPSIMASINGKMVVVLGRNWTGNEWVSWFQASRDFDRYAFEITQFVIDMADFYGGEVSVYSVCSHPQASRWFGAMGYERDDGFSGQTARGFPLYRFVRKDNYVL